MTTIDRNPDIDAENDPVPDGCYIARDKNLMRYARSCTPPVPFGLAWKRVPMGISSSRRETVGLVIRWAGQQMIALSRKADARDCASESQRKAAGKADEKPDGQAENADGPRN